MPRPVLLLAAVTLVAAALALLLSGSPGDAPATNPAGKSEDTTAPVEEVAEDRDAEVTCRVRGLVLDRETHEPVVAAEVRYAVDESTVFSVTTDGEGAWSVCVPGEVPEDNPARVTAPGYLPGTAWLDIASEWTLHPPIVLTRLRPVRTMVCGEVVDPEGRPVAGAKVSPDHGVVAVTDTRGEFRDLPWAAERLWLTVVAKGYPTIGKTVDTSFGPAPETRVRIVLPHPVVARGLVVDDLGRPVPGVLLHDDMEDLRRETRTGAGGRFTWLVPRHGYAWLVVEKEGYLLPEDDEEEVMVHASHEVRIVLDRAGVLAGRVLPPPSGERPAGLMVATWAMRTPVEPDGTFRFAAHPSGEGVLSVVRPPEFTSPRHVPPWQVFSESKVSFELRPGEVLDDFVLEVGEVRRATGRILDAVTGRPVVGASVVSGLTDGDGRFEWTVPAAAPEDDLVVEILADGYLPWRGRFAPEIRLMPWREVEIRVTGPDGEPVKGLGLWPDLPLVNAWMISTVTDREGRARVRVAATGHSLVRHSDDRFPKSTVDVPPGAERIEWQLDARPVSLTIFAVDEADKPIRDVRIRAGPWPRTEFGDGRVGFGERKYAVVIGATRYEDRAIAPSEWKERESLTVTLRRAADLRGRVLDADGAPVAEASARTSYSHREYTDGDGRFRLSRVAAGETAEVVVEVDGWPARTVPIVAGGPEVTVRLSPRGSIRIRFPRERGTGPEQFVVFGGTVSDGTVWIESESYTSRLFAQEDPEGLTLSVPVGARNLWLRVPPGLPRHYLGLHVAPGETVGVEYDFPKLGRLVGTVTDPSGNPVVDASVYLDGPDFEIATTDEEGRFRMDPGEIDWDSMDISVGPWPLVVSSDEFAPHVTPSVDLTQDRDLSIRVQKGGHLSGRVVPAADYFAIEVAGVLRSHISFMLTREKGSFRSLTPIPPGRQRIIFTLPRGRVMERTVTIQAGEVTTVVVDAN